MGCSPADANVAEVIGAVVVCCLLPSPPLVVMCIDPSHWLVRLTSAGVLLRLFDLAESSKSLANAEFFWMAADFQLPQTQTSARFVV